MGSGQFRPSAFSWWSGMGRNPANGAMQDLQNRDAPKKAIWADFGFKQSLC
jgi:hypothetical protein